MRNSKGVSLIALIITIIVIIILAAIVLSSGGDTTNKAQLAVFQNNFSQYYDRLVMDELNVKQTLGVRDETVNDAQLHYMIANGLKSASGDTEVMNRTLPVGYVMPKTIRNIFKVDPENSVVAYVIDDANITGYDSKGGNKNDGSAGYEFYGDTNGDEYHFVTSNGHVFTIPGFPLPIEDGTIQFYISNEKGAYYIAKGNSNLKVGDPNVNGDKVDELDPILGVDFINGAGTTDTGMYGRTSKNNDVVKYGDIEKDKVMSADGTTPLFNGATALPAEKRQTVIGGQSHVSVAAEGYQKATT